MNIKIILQKVAASMILLALSSCASTQLSHEWRDPLFVSDTTKNILVVAVREDRLIRQAWEDDFAQAISERGVRAVPSYHLFAESLSDTNLIEAIAGQGNFDKIVFLEKISIETRANVSPGFYINTPEFPSRPNDGWLFTYYDRGYYPGYPSVDRVVKDEIKVWTIRNGTRLVWTGIGETQVSGTREDVRNRIIQLVLSELVKQGVIASEP